ncbi:MAG: processing protein [Nocardioidaceae bacterium]|nr:processing protein [Nocardioidaceae bacterium]
MTGGAPAEEHRAAPSLLVPDEERRARAALNAITEPGDPRVARLVELLGPVELHDRLSADTDLAGLRSETAERLAGMDVDRLLGEAAASGIRFLVPGDPEWPSGLDELAAVEQLNGLTGAPLGLWVRGSLRLDVGLERSVAVVGSRSATSYGLEIAKDLAVGTAGAGHTVVSGAAFGIDQAAHRGALAAHGRTVAVLACGVDRPYPTGHRELLDYIADIGAVVSELRPGCSPTRVRFLSRNRLIAAMTAGTVVVEAAVRSGALNTANWAGRLNRVLMAVPGPVTSAPSEGTHELIRTGGASLVTRAEHVLELVSPTGTHLTRRPRADEVPRDRLSLTESRVLEAVPLVQPATTASIARTAGLAEATVTDVLVGLRESGWVVGDRRWRRSTDTPEG